MACSSCSRPGRADGGACLVAIKSWLGWLIPCAVARRARRDPSRPVARLWADRNDVVLDLVADQVFDVLREELVRVLVRLELRVAASQLKETEALALDQLRGHALLAPDVAPAEQALKAGADRDQQADDDRCEREHPGGIPPEVLELPQADQGRNERATHDDHAAQRQILPLRLGGARIPPLHILKPAGVDVLVQSLIAQLNACHERLQLIEIDELWAV